jgi:hypothetical protein
MSRARIAASLAAMALAAAMLAGTAAGDGGKAFTESWQRSYVSPEHPKVIKVAYETSPSYALDHASVYFHEDRVAITVWLRGPKHGWAVMSAVVRCATVRLGEPLRGRTRIDGKTHRHPKKAKNPFVSGFKLKRAHCPKAKVVRHHFE